MSATIGRYVVLRELGRGAMGVVYLASDSILNRQVALKTLDLNVSDVSQREFLRNQLLQDARAAALLKHPNIVAIYDIFEQGTCFYVVMEFVEGESLQALNTKGHLDMAATLRVVRQAAEALDHTHARGVIHRDIKPANIMIDTLGETKIMDFGIARITNARTCTPTGMVMGTVEYMSPEQVVGQSLDGRSDQFALGVVAYQMITGSIPYGPGSIATLTYKIVNEIAPLASTRKLDLPPGTDVVLAKVLSKNPAERFANCKDFARALAQVFEDRRSTFTHGAPEPIRENKIADQAAHPAPTRGRWRTAGAIVGVGALAVVCAIGLTLWKPWSHNPQPPVARVSPAPLPPSSVQPAAPGGTTSPPAALPPTDKPSTGQKPPPKEIEPHPKTAPPVVSKLTASPSPDQAGEQLVQWSVQGATRISITGLGDGLPALGSRLIRLDSSKTFTLEATGPGGSVTRSLRVVIEPPAAPAQPMIKTFDASPPAIKSGETSVLRWKVSGANEVRIKGIGRAFQAQDSIPVCPTASKEYLLEVPGTGVGRSVLLNVTIPPGENVKLIRFLSAPSEIVAGESSELSWNVENASEVSIEPEIGPVDACGKLRVHPSATTKYRLTYQNNRGRLTKPLQITVR